MLKFSANLSLLFTEYPLLERFSKAKKAGFNAVEIQFPYFADPQAIKEQLLVNNLSLNLINIPAANLLTGGDGLACVPTREHEFKQAVQTAAAWARELQIPQVNLLSGKQPNHCDLSACLTTLVNNMRYAATVLADIGVTLVFEAINNKDMPRCVISNIDQQLEMLEAVNHDNVALQFDCYHMAMNHENIMALLKSHIDVIAHIQFADCPHRHEPSTGSLDYPMIFKCLEDLDYAGFVAAEYKPLKGTLNSLTWLDDYLR